MNVQNVGLSNFNFKQNIPRGKYYDLCSLTKLGGYKDLPPKEKRLLYMNGLNKKKLNVLFDSLSTIEDYKTIDHIGKHGLGLRREGFQLEIGQTCRLLLLVFFRSFIRLPEKYLVFPVNVTKETVEKKYVEIIDEYHKMMANPEAGTEEEFYHSKTLSTLYSSKFKVRPQKTEKGYLTTIIDKESGKPENAYINIEYSSHYTNFILSKDMDNKHPINAYLLDENKHLQPELANFEFKKDSTDMKAQVLGFNEPRIQDYGGVAYRIIQALIEYSLQKDTNIIICCNGDDLPLYTKAGFRVNPEKDKFIAENNWYWEFMYKECDSFGISREEFKSALKKREKDGVTGFGEDETWETFVRLLYQKNKNCGYYEHMFHLELTPEAKQVWLERIKSQPIFPETQNLIEKGII